MSSINKILNDALDQTLLTENEDIVDNEEQLTEAAWAERKVRGALDTIKGAAASANQSVNDFMNSIGKGIGKGVSDGIDKVTGTDNRSTVQKIKDSPYKSGAIAMGSLGAGVGAVLLAKKLRAQKRKADKKKAKA